MKLNVIKYQNRKLYSPDISSYISLKELSDMVKEGFDLSVRNYNDEDITKDILKDLIKFVDANDAMLYNIIRK